MEEFDEMGRLESVALLYEQAKKAVYRERGNNQTKGRNNQKVAFLHRFNSVKDTQSTTTIVSVFL